MPRVRWCPTRRRKLLFLLIFNSLWVLAATADCWYNGEKHEEGSEVATVEPCLNCTCTKGALICYLRVCPRLPDPPPPGCILLHRYMTCCPELICTDIPGGGGNGIEARSDTDIFDLEYNVKKLGDACFLNGTIYGPGSAMDSSNYCEYCYCLGGKQRCVKPKCLLPLEGCSPSYEPHICCPIRYNCTEAPPSIVTTTPSPYLEERSGCVVSNTFYPEGGKVLGVGHSVCDNCYCIRGLLRCEPLSCAPPLLGCAPVVKPGECCAASYNCSGIIEIQPEPNYGHYPIVSKDYAKLRKEVQQRPHLNKQSISAEGSSAAVIVLAETQKQQPISGGDVSSSSGKPTTRHFGGGGFAASGRSTEAPPPPPPGKIREALLDHRKRPGDLRHKPGAHRATVGYDSYKVNPSIANGPVSHQDHTTHKSLNSITSEEQGHKHQEKLRFDDYSDFSKQAILSIVDAFLGDRLDVGIEEEKTVGDVERTTTYTSTESTTEPFGSTTNIAFTTPTYNTEAHDTTTGSFTEFDSTTATTITNTTDCTMQNLEEVANANEAPGVLEKRQDYDFITTILPADIGEINELQETTSVDNEIPTSTEVDIGITTTIAKDNATTMQSEESAIELSHAPHDAIPKIPPEIEAILNMTTKDEKDYNDYDYSEPSLPPSLPNLRIIPFVAADALDAKRTDPQDNAVYPLAKERVTDQGLLTYNSLFSPPVETEGGFVPKEPPLLDAFYESGYHTTGVEANAVTSGAIPSITNSPKSEHNCVSNGQEFRHGEEVESSSACVLCACFYGNIVCQQPQCPPPRSGCRKANMPDESTCCPHYICDDGEAPSVVLEDAADPPELVTVADRLVTPDPFRDVIRTEPAPDLPSLMGDMMPYLARKPTTSAPSVGEDKKPQNESAGEGEEFSLQKALLQLLFPEETSTAAQTTNLSFPATTPAPPGGGERERGESSTESWPQETREDEGKHPNSVEAPSGVGLLKLAGCNIYGRMYRVGRIISELSGPCLECKCTEIGVQCRALNC